MCGRFSAAIRIPDAAKELGATIAIAPDRPPSFNVAPTQDAPIVIEREERRLGLARFGLVPASSEGPRAIGARYINLRAEGVAAQKAFAEGAAQRRCLVITDGFFEWRSEGKGKQPYFVRPVGGGLLTLAGIWEIWRRGDERIASFAILTTAPSAVVREIHDRMPLVVPPAARDVWLSREEQDARAALSAVRRAEPVLLEAFRVSPRVGSPRHDDPELVLPIDGERKVGPSRDPSASEGPGGGPSG